MYKSVYIHAGWYFAIVRSYINTYRGVIDIPVDGNCKIYPRGSWKASSVRESAENTCNIDLLMITRVYIYDTVYTHCVIIVSAKLVLYIELELEGNVTVLCT